MTDRDDSDHSDKDTEAIRKLRTCLERHVRVALDDGRVVVGRFRCADDHGNLVLADAYELRTVIDDTLPNNTSAYTHTRTLVRVARRVAADGAQRFSTPTCC